MHGRSLAGLLVLLVFLVGFPAYGQETIELQEKGRAYFDFGVFAFEEGDLKDAETNLKIALSLSPDNSYYHHYLGKTYLKMGRYEESMTSLKNAASLDSKIPGLQYDLAYLNYRMGNHARAASLFQALAREDPDHVLAQYYAGITHFKQEHYAEATDYFITAAENSPTIRANGYYYAGICYQKTGDIDTALTMFNRVLEASEPGVLSENAARWIEAIKQEEVRLRPLSLFLKAGRRYDDNVRLDPDDIDLFADESDWATLLYLTGQYDFLIRDRYSAGIGYSHYQTRYDDLDTYNLIGTLPQLYLSYNWQPFILRFNYQPVYYWVDSESYLRQHRLEPEALWRVNRKLLTRLSYRYHDNHYFQDTERTGHTNEVLADAFYSVFDQRGRLFAGFGYEDTTAAQQDEFYTRWRARAGALFNLPWHLDLGVSMEYQDKQYDTADRVYGVERNDDRFIAGISLSRRIYKEWLKILAEHRYTQNDSNINDYEYTRNISTLSLSLTY